MIDFAMTTPIEDVEVHHFPLEIISEILQQVNKSFGVNNHFLWYFFSNNLIFRDMFMRMLLLHWHLYSRKTIHHLKSVTFLVE